MPTQGKSAPAASTTTSSIPSATPGASTPAAVPAPTPGVVNNARSGAVLPKGFALPDQWKGARVLEFREPPAPDGVLLREYVLRLDSFPYPVRVHEEYRTDAAGPLVLANRQECVADHVMIKLSPKQDRQAFEAAIAGLGLTIMREYKNGTVLLQTPEVTLDSVPVTQAKLEELLNCEYTEPDPIQHASVVPNDPSYSSLWAMPKIQAPQAWDVRSDASSVVVAVVDSGIRYTHDDLSANMWKNSGEIAGNGIDDDGNGYVDDIYGIDAANNDRDPMDDNGHGSHCSGTIGAAGNNGKGVAGAAWKVKLMALKFLSSGGSGATSDELDCIQYAIDEGAKILSCSFGQSDGSVQSEYDMLQMARTAGIIVVAAAGNDSANNDITPHYPSSYNLDNIVAVAATTQTDALRTSSCYGSTSVDIGAPGESIYSTYFSSNSSYGTMSGTSMATPLVAGCLAVLKAQYPASDYLSLINRIYIGGSSVSSLSGKVKSGKRLNLYGALQATPPLSPPAGVTASDGTYSDKVAVTWNAVSGATHYQVYRATSSTGTFQSLSLWQTGLSYNDTSATAGQTYYYKVKAAASSSGGNASDFSASDSGWMKTSATYPDQWDPADDTASGATSLTVASTVQPHGPHGLASNDQYDCFKVNLAAGNSYTFESTGSSDTFGELYNSTTFNSTTMVASNDDSGEGLNFKVVFSPASTGYYYLRARAYTVGNNATYTLSYSSASAQVPAPAGVAASDTDPAKVRVTWTAPTGASHYQVYRATSSNGTKSTLTTAWQTATSFDDTTAAAGTTYYYWVKAAANSTGTGESNYSAYDTGIRPAASKPDLLPCKPSDWDDKLVVSTVTGTNTSATTILTTDTLYLDTAALNDGTVSVPGPLTIYKIYVDNQLVSTHTKPNALSGGYYSYHLDAKLGSLAAGQHTIKIVVDPDGAVDESNEGNNEYTRTITVSAPAVALSSLSISGPATVNENSSASFTCTAVYSDSTTANVTASAAWSENSSYASIAGGVLTTGNVTSDQAVTVSTSFTAGSVTKNATANVTIKNLADPVTVSNLAFRQRPGTKMVDITYDLASTSAQTATVALAVKNGTTALSTASATGHIGGNVTIGTGKAILWNMAADWNGQFSNNISVTLSASTGDIPPPVAEMVLIPAGSFQMGNALSASGDGSSNELPVHTVSVSAFYMDKYEVTKELWDEVRAWGMNNGYTDLPVGNEGYASKGANHPVHWISWYAMVKWCNARSKKAGLTECYTVSGSVYKTGDVAPVLNLSANGYRLPTEAEWEKAARGGLSGKRFPWGDTISRSQANYYVYTSGTSNYYSYDQGTPAGYDPTYATGSYPYSSPVGSFAANEYGLHDMAGNLWERCWDWYGSYGSGSSSDPTGPASGSYRVLRGGSWYCNAFNCRVAYRYGGDPANGDYSIGFRCARSSVP